MSERTYGHTTSGKPIADATVEELAGEAEQGYEPGQLRGAVVVPGAIHLGPR